jgi:hypothetical protein
MYMRNGAKQSGGIRFAVAVAVVLAFALAPLSFPQRSGEICRFAQVSGHATRRNHLAHFRNRTPPSLMAQPLE